MHRIEAELLIPGHGGPIRDGVVVLDGSRCTRDLRAALDAGITSVRDVGGVHLARAVAEGLVDGRRYTARGRSGPHHRGLDQRAAGQGSCGLTGVEPVLTRTLRPAG